MLTPTGSSTYLARKQRLLLHNQNTSSSAAQHRLVLPFEQVEVLEQEEDLFDPTAEARSSAF